MRPEIVHLPKPKTLPTVFGALLKGAFFTTSNGGLFQKIGANMAMIFEPLRDRGAGESYQETLFSSESIVTPVRVRIEVQS